MYKSFEAPAIISPEAQAHAYLRMLGEYLVALPVGYIHFDMESYYYDPKVGMHSHDVMEMRAAADPSRFVCGTVACALGHGPAAGIPFEDCDSWEDFAYSVLGVRDPLAYEYMFGGGWAFHDNTPQGAGQRILNYLKFGVPDGFEPKEWIMPSEWAA